MARTSIGIDIGTRAVGIAEVSGGNGHRAVTRFGRALLPAGAVEHGEIQDPQAVGRAVASLYKKLGLSGRSVHIGVSNRHVVVRVIELPAMSREDLANAIRFQAQEHIPIPLDQAVVDYQVLEELDVPEGQRLQRVLVVAAERTTIEPLLAALQAARLDPSSLELNAYPLVRCFGDDAATGMSAIIDVGGGVTNIVVHHNGTIRFTRILPNFGGDDFTDAIAEGMRISHEDAESLKRRAGSALSNRVGQPERVEKAPEPELVPASVQHTDNGNADAESSTTDEEPYESIAMPSFAQDEPEETPVHVSRSDVDQAADLVEPVVQRFVNEVRGSIDFYVSQPDALPIERIVLTGGGALLGGLTQRLEQALGIPVEQGRPLASVTVGRMKVSADQVSVAEPFLGVAVRLALAGA
jgi:type IV pilus assembly protein PilM